MHEAFYAGFFGRIEDAPRAKHIDAPRFFAHDVVRHNRGSVDHQITAINVRLPLFRSGDIAGDNIAVESARTSTRASLRPMRDNAPRARVRRIRVRQ